MRHNVPTPNTGTGWLWLAVGVFALFTFATKGGEFADGFNKGFGDTCAPFFAAEPGDPPANLSPACDANGNPYNRTVAGATAEVAGGAGN